MIQITFDIDDPKSRKAVYSFLASIEGPVETKPQPDQKSAKKKNQKTEPAEPKTETEPVPESTPEPETAEAKAITKEDLEALVKRIFLADSSKVPEIKKILLEFGAARVGELVSDDYEDAYKRISALEG